MRSTIFLWNVVGKATYIFLIGIIPLQRHFNTNAIFSLYGEMENVIQMGFALVNIFHKLRQTAFVVKHMFCMNTLVTQNNAHARV